MNSFRLPIHYMENKTKIDENLVRDLELLPITKSTSEHIDDTDSTSIAQSKIETDGLYKTFLESNGAYSKKLIPMWASYYTADQEYIKDTQALLTSDLPSIVCTNKFEKIWNDVNTETGFYSKYKYLENSLPLAKHLNCNPVFLRFLSLYNISSPVLSLAIPVLFMILPFFIIKIQGYPITVSKYREVLAVVFKKHQIGQLFRISTCNFNQQIYILVSLAFYVFQTYQNIISCISVYKHTSIINNNLRESRDYLRNTIQCMDRLTQTCSILDTYSPFISDMNIHREKLINYLTLLESENYTMATVMRTTCMGSFMSLFEKLYNDVSLHDSIEYTMYFHSYLENMSVIQKHLTTKVNYEH